MLIQWMSLVDNPVPNGIHPTTSYILSIIEHLPTGIYIQVPCKKLCVFPGDSFVHITAHQGYNMIQLDFNISQTFL